MNRRPTPKPGPKPPAGVPGVFDESKHLRDQSGKFTQKPVIETQGGLGALVYGPWPEKPPTPPPFDDTVFFGSSFKHHVSAKRSYHVLANPLEFRTSRYPSRNEKYPEPPILFVGYGSANGTTPLEVLASIGNDGEWRVFHSMRARDKTCREMGYDSLADFLEQHPPQVTETREEVA